MNTFQAKVHTGNRISCCHYDQKVAGRIHFAWKKVLNIAIWCLISFSSLHTLSASSEETTAHEPSLRGAVIAGILRFTYWQDQNTVNSQKLTLCLAGNPSSSLPLINNSFNKPIGEVFHIPNKAPTKDLVNKKCEVIILGPELNITTIREIQQSATSQNWLTICDDCKQHDEVNTIISLHKVDHRIIFNVDLTAAKNSQLRFSASLLELAAKVDG